ncbi:MAG: FlgD immunoglobulin-like domain containing protein, partial [bacterium]
QQKSVGNFGSEIDIQPRIFSPLSGSSRYGPHARISFALQNTSLVTVKIYNSAGRLKKVLTESISMQSGSNIITWDGRDDDGQFCVSGLYIVTIEAEGKVWQKTVVIRN